MNGHDTIEQLPLLASCAAVSTPPLPPGRYVELPGRGTDLRASRPRAGPMRRP